MTEIKERLRQIIHDATVSFLGSAKAKACSEHITEAIIHSGILKGEGVDGRG